MKRSKAIVVIIVCTIAFAVLCALGYMVYSTNDLGEVSNKTTKSYSVYFLDSTKTKLVSETTSVEPMGSIDTLCVLTNVLIKGPKDSVEKKRAIPEDTQLLSLECDDGIATVNLSSAFYGENDIDNSLAAATIVKTLCETNLVTKVKILVDGNELINSDKIAYGALGSEDIIDSSQAKNNSLVISLYFADKDAASLQLEKRSVTQNDKEPVEKIVVNELMRGSLSAGLTLIPAEAKLISTEIKDGVCFVNFSKEFADKRTAGSSSELLTIYSIVNTLTELDNINKVQFLIEGQKIETYGEIVFDEPFVRNEDLIGQ